MCHKLFIGGEPACAVSDCTPIGGDLLVVGVRLADWLFAWQRETLLLFAG